MRLSREGMDRVDAIQAEGRARPKPGFEGRSLPVRPQHRCPRVLFLDVDGVLNCVEYQREMARMGTRMKDSICDPRCVRMVLDVVRETDARIVISSTHREDTITKTRSVFASAPYGKFPSELIVGVTPRGERLPSGLIRATTRGHEIQAWLDANSRFGVERIAILDDDPDMEHLMPFLVRTSYQTGLTAEHIARVREMLLHGP